MTDGEFGLIRRHFQTTDLPAGVVLGVGDDGALLTLPAGHELVVSTDTLVAGVHFLPDAPAHAIGHKALAVNLSDLAAMGATPRYVLLALTLPQLDDTWVGDFMSGWRALAVRHGVALVGGDTTRGPLSITVTALGSAPSGAALRRAGAMPGDGIYLSGALGGAGLALRARRGEVTLSVAQLSGAQQRLDYPQPRVGLGEALRGVASACVDVSDGLAADLGHVLTASGVGARLDLEAMPWCPGVAPDDDARAAALSAGDDYELCFTAPSASATAVQALAGLAPVTRIGTIEAEPGLRLLRADGSRLQLTREGYDHGAA